MNLHRFHDSAVIPASGGDQTHPFSTAVSELVEKYAAKAEAQGLVVDWSTVTLSTLSIAGNSVLLTLDGFGTRP